MYISFLGNKKNNLKKAGIILVGLICLLGFNNLVCKLVKVDSMFELAGRFLYENIGEVTTDIYKFIVTYEYNINGYNKITEYKYKDYSVKETLANLVNKNNNLYSFVIEENADAISYVQRDPSYEKKDFMGTKDTNVAKTDTVQADTVNTAVTDSSGEEKGDEEEAYVIPAVATEGVVYDMDKLSDFNYLLSELYIVPSRAKVIESELVASEMIAKDMTIKGDNTKPQILIYHTHSQEGFVDSVKGDDSTTIVGVGAYLAKILSEVYGYNVIHCTEKFDIKNGSLDRSKAYTYAEETITQILEDNPTIEVILDIHRDGLKEGADKLVTNINGKETAKIMFFNGVSRSSKSGDIDYLFNRYKKDNLAFSFQLKLKAMECFPEFTRKNYIDAYQYNLHLRPKSVLVEVGAQNNTLKEELNAMEVLAEVLHRVIK